MEGESPVLLYEVDVTVPTFVLFRYTSYPVTPTLSVETPHTKLICVADMTEAVKFPGAVGALVSEAGDVVAETVLDDDERFPAASKALT